MCVFLITSLIKPIRVSYKWEVNLGNEINCRPRRGRSCGNNAGESRQLAKSTQCKSHVDIFSCPTAGNVSLNLWILDVLSVSLLRRQRCSNSNSQEFWKFKLASTKLLIMSKMILKSRDRRDGVMTLFDFDGWLHFAPTITQLLLETLLRSHPSHDGRSYFYTAALWTRSSHSYSPSITVALLRSPDLSLFFFLFLNLTLKEQTVPHSPGLKHRKAPVHFSALIQLPVSRLSPHISHSSHAAACLTLRSQWITSLLIPENLQVEVLGCLTWIRARWKQSFSRSWHSYQFFLPLKFNPETLNYVIYKYIYIVWSFLEDIPFTQVTNNHFDIHFYWGWRS